MPPLSLASLTASSAHLTWSRASAANGPVSGVGKPMRIVSSAARPCVDMGDDDVGHLPRHRDEVVGERAVHELAGLAVAAFLEQSRAQSLHDTAAELLVHQHRIDDPATILDDEMLQHLDESGLD